MTARSALGILSTGPILSVVIVLSSSAWRAFNNECFQELLGEVFHAVPVRVDVVSRGVGVRSPLVAGDLLHNPAFEEPVSGVEQSAGEETDFTGTPARLLYELSDTAFYFVACFLGVVMGGETYREKGGWETFESVAVLPDEVPDAVLMLAHVDGAPHDHRVVAIRFGGAGAFDVYRVRLIALLPDRVSEVLRNP